MKYIIDNDLHIHSQLSSCSRDPEQNPEALLAYAVKNGFTTICIADHYWDERIPGASNWYCLSPPAAGRWCALPLWLRDGVEPFQYHRHQP